MKMVWRLILKDHRVLRWSLLGWLLLQGLYYGLCYVDWHVSATKEVALAGRFLLLFIIVYGAVFFASHIQKEPLVEGDDFWRTRPLRPGKLFLGKALFVLCYGFVVPGLLQLVFLLMVGFREHLIAGFVEWLWFQCQWLIPACGLAVLTSTMTRLINLVMLIGLGLLMAFLVAAPLRQQFPWLQTTLIDFPGRPTALALLAVATGLIAIFIQYFHGKRRTALRLLFAGFCLAVCLCWFPLHGREVSRPTPFLQSSEELEKRLAADPIEISPLGRLAESEDSRSTDRYWDVRRNVRIPAGVHLAVEPTQSEFDFSDRRVRSVAQHSVHVGTGMSDIEISRLVDAPPAAWPASPNRSGSMSLIRIPYQTAHEIGDERGTFNGKFVAYLQEPTVIMRLPLIEGSRIQEGPISAEVVSVKRLPDRLLIEITENWPRNLWFPKRPEVDLRERAQAVLHHRPTGALVKSQFRSGRRGGINPSLHRSQTKREFRHQASGWILGPLLASKEFNAAEWELVYGGNRVVASKPIRVSVPNFRLNRNVPATEAEVLEQVEQLRVPPNLTDELTEALLWDLWSLWHYNAGEWKKFQGPYEDRFRQKLRQIAPSPEVSIRVARAMLNYPLDLTGRRIMKEFLSETVGPDDKALIISQNSPSFSLLKIIKEQGWETEALADMIEKTRRAQCPSDWAQYFLAIAPRHREVYDALFDYHYRTMVFVDRNAAFTKLRALPGFPIEELVDTALKMEIGDRSRRVIKLIECALELGRPMALGYARILLLNEAVPYNLRTWVLEKLITVSDCPPAEAKALEWLQRNHESAVFNEEAGLYETTEASEE